MGVIDRAYQEAESLLPGNSKAPIRSIQRVRPALEMEGVQFAAAIICERVGEW